MLECVICGGPMTNYRIKRVMLAYGDWTRLCADIDSMKLLAYGDGVAEYRPKFCPECGRRVNYDI